MSGIGGGLPEGVWTALVTPFADDERQSVDFDALGALVEAEKAKEPEKTTSTAPKTEEEEEGPTILTGSKKGNYYKAATELNEVLGKKLKLEVKESAGSFENLKQVGQNKADYAIVQLDTLIMFLRMGDPHKGWANNALGVDHKQGTFAGAFFFAIHAIGLGHCALRVEIG